MKAIGKHEKKKELGNTKNFKLEVPDRDSLNDIDLSNDLNDTTYICMYTLISGGNELVGKEKLCGIVITQIIFCHKTKPLLPEGQI